MPDWMDIFAISFGSVAVVLLCFLAARRLHKPIDLGTDQSFLDAMLTIVGTLVSILLGLLVAASLDRYQRLEDSTDSEARAVSDIFRLARSMPKDQTEKIQGLCMRYCNSIIKDEWPALEKGEASIELFHVYGELMDTVLACDPQTQRESNIHQCMMTAMLELGDDRRARLLAMTRSWTSALGPVLGFSAISVLFFAYLYMKQSSKLHLLLVCVVTLCLASNIGLIVMLNTPFSGPLRIQPTSFKFNIDLLAKIAKQIEAERNVNHDGMKMPIAPK